jgi:hypothetical protein
VGATDPKFGEHRVRLASLVADAQRSGCARATGEARPVIADHVAAPGQRRLAEQRGEPVGEQRGVDKQDRVTGATLLEFELNIAEIESAQAGSGDGAGDRAGWIGATGAFSLVRSLD